jgi:hypothetical protein
VRAVVPYQLQAAPSGTQTVRDGAGWIAFGVSTALATPVVITYPFGRVPLFVRLLDNGATAQTRLQVTARSATAVTIVPLDAALTSASVEIR